MAFFQCTHKSEVLGKSHNFNVIIPEGCNENDIPWLLLLHGHTDDNTYWSRYTRVESYANARKLAVVMPMGDLSYYTDMAFGGKYYTYITEELIPYVRKIFRLSKNREKTFVCGNSMGGYGAFKLAFSAPELFSAAISMSGDLDMAGYTSEHRIRDSMKLIWNAEMNTELKGSDADLYHLLSLLVNRNDYKVRLLQICGTSDFLYQVNLDFKAYCESFDIDFKYLEGEGDHGWTFWDRWLPAAMDFALK